MGKVTCPTTNITETAVNEYVRRLLMPLQFNPDEKREFSNHVSAIASQWEREKQTISNALQIRLDGLSSRVEKLTDAYLDGLINKQAFEQRKNALIIERQGIAREMEQVAHETGGAFIKTLSEYVALAERAYLLYENGNIEEKRELLRLITSQRLVNCKTPIFTMHPAFQELADRHKNTGGGTSCEIHRRIGAVIERIMSIVPRDFKNFEDRIQHSSLGCG